MRIFKALTVMLLTCVLGISCTLFCVTVSSYLSSDDFSYELTYEVNGTEATVTGCEDEIFGVLKIPETIDGYTVTAIDQFAFANCETLTNIVFPQSLKKIGNGAFVACVGLESVAIPKNVRSVGEGAFANCDELYSLTVVEGVKRIEAFAFNGCVKLDRITLANSIEYIGCSAFDNTQYCNEPDYDGYGALYVDNHLVELKGKTFGPFEVRDGTRSIGACAFVRTPEIEYITVPSTLNSIADTAFFGCDSLKQISGKEANFNLNTVSVGTYNGALNSVKTSFSGDVNQNGTLETADAVYLMYYTLYGEEYFPIYGKCDFDNNGMVDSDDAVYLLYHILFGDEYKLFPSDVPQWNPDNVNGEMSDSDDDFTDWTPTYPDETDKVIPDDGSGFGNPEDPDEDYTDWVPIW